MTTEDEQRRTAAMLERDEGRVRYAYQDSLGYWTIGVGHLIDKRRGGGLPDHIIDLLLEWDMQQAEAELVAVYPWVSRLDPPRRAVLICMEFQLPYRGLVGFPRAMEAMRAGDYELAADRFLQSKVAREQAPKRWQRFARQISTGEWQ